MVMTTVKWFNHSLMLIPSHGPCQLFRPCLVPRKFEEKYETNKIERKSKRKEKEKKNFKKRFEVNKLFYMLLQTYLTYLKSCT